MKDLLSRDCVPTVPPSCSLPCSGAVTCPICTLSLLPTSTVKEDALGLPTLPTLIFKSKRLRMTYHGSLGHLDLKLHRSHILIISETPYALLEKFLVMWLSSARKIIIPEHHQLPHFSHSMIAVVQSLSHVRLSAISWTTARQVSLSFTISQSLLKFMSIESVMLSNHLILCHPLLLLSSIFPSIRVFSSELALCTTWPKYWSFSFSTSHSNEYSGLISLRIDWFDLCAVQGTLRSLLQHHNSKASILCCLVFFLVQLSHLYTTTGKTIAFINRTLESDIFALLIGWLLSLKSMLQFLLGFPGWQRIHLPMQETLTQSLNWEDPLEKEKATHSSILAWGILWTEEPGGLHGITTDLDTTKQLSNNNNHSCYQLHLKLLFLFLVPKTLNFETFYSLNCILLSNIFVLLIININLKTQSVWDNYW